MEVIVDDRGIAGRVGSAHGRLFRRRGVEGGVRMSYQRIVLSELVLLHLHLPQIVRLVGGKVLIARVVC